MKRRVVTAVVLGMLIGERAQAQTSSATLVDQMRELFLQSVVLSTTPGGVGVVAHTPVFLNDPRVVEATTLIDQISQHIGSQVSIFPLGSSSGGFTYAYDSSLGTFNRSTQTFGPAFAERAPGLGKGKFSFGMNFVHTKYESLDGFDLQDGAIKINLKHQALSPPSFVEGDVIQAGLKMKLTSDAAVFLLNYGITDRLDIGVGVPIVRVAMDLAYQATILDYATRTVAPTLHVFEDGTKTREFRPEKKGSASGVGDVIVRSKYSLTSRPNGGLGAGVEIRLPTGDEENMLGAGAAQTRVFFIGSGGSGDATAHVNVGYTVAGSTAYDQVNYVAGVEYAATPKVTIVGDLLGRTLREALRLNDGATTIQFQQGPGAAVQTTTVDTVALSSGNVNSLIGAAGVKLNPWGNLLLSAHVLIPLNKSGLKSSLTPVIGFEYSF